jgi:hypothetical protein
MPPHIDSYPVKHIGTVIEDATWGEPKRLYEGQEAFDYAELLYAAGYILGRFNGYTYVTGVHDDNECDLFRPATQFGILMK